MEKKLYVGNLSYETDTNRLQTLFGEAGAVTDAVVIMDRQTGQSKGFGFVEMADEQSAQAAVDRFNGSELDGRTIKVAEAKPRADRGDRSYGSSRQRGSW